MVWFRSPVERFEKGKRQLEGADRKKQNGFMGVFSPIVMAGGHGTRTLT
jgi:hypothetical protein